jgi:hypothetical protein
MMQTNGLREGIERLIDQVEMTAFNNGFESCLNALDELSNQLNNDHLHDEAELLRWAVKELNGENDVPIYQRD